MKKIILTGGGSAGHVTPNLALIPRLKELGYEVQYIGSKDGIEKKIIEDENIKYHSISSGKLRRYFDLKNFSDPFKVIKGIRDASLILKKEKPDIVFSKGGFVSVPVVIAAHNNKIPVVIHESDITPGLANKISIPFTNKVCVTFPESLKEIKGNKAVLTGTPVRHELYQGSKILGVKYCGFVSQKPILMIIGGSLGSRVINETVRECLAKLLEKYNVIHICGKNNIQEELKNKPGYAQFEYVSQELPNLMEASDIVISRAGANTIFELLALKKPNILIPLSLNQSRGDQILNAASFEKSGYSCILTEENLNVDNLIDKIEDTYRNREIFIKNMSKSDAKDGVSAIINVILENSK